MEKTKRKIPTEKKECPLCGKLCNIMGYKNHIRLKHLVKITEEVIAVNNNPPKIHKCPIQNAGNQEDNIKTTPTTGLVNIKYQSDIDANWLTTEELIARIKLEGEQWIIYCPLCSNYHISPYADWYNDMQDHLKKHNKNSGQPFIQRLLDEQIEQIMSKIKLLYRKN